jgi:2-dehydropantoate 2-reductase
LEGEFDYVLIATKGDALEHAAMGILPCLSKDSRVVSMQNGICVDILAEVVGMERAIGCVVGWAGNLIEPGKVRMTSGGECVLGNWKREPDEKLSALAKIMEQVIPTRTTGDILSELYSKLIINSCISTLGVLSGLYLGEILRIRRVRKIIMEMIRESMQVAEAMRIRVAPGAQGKLDYYKFVAPGFLSDLKRHLTIRVVGIKYRKHKSYNLQRLARGRKTEVEYYNGYIADRGREFGVPTPVHAQLTQMVHEIEEGKRQISPANFQELRLK